MPLRSFTLKSIAGSAIATALTVLPPGQAIAQGNDVAQISEPVVQAIPGVESMRLNAALAQLGRDPRDVMALLAAGQAALDVGDTDAGLGFFKRADALAPNNPRVKAGLASAYVRKEDPFSAIPLFQAAEQAGPIDPALLSECGLAFDLVGDSAKAQQFYRQSLALARSDETTRRLALSQAIAGDKRGMETTLSPLLAKQDKAAWRTRAFGFAILGQADEAEAIARSTMPAEMAGAIAPYLRYMPKLTEAQQAAAANFGRFPRAAEIGRDDPRIALYAAAKPARTALASADARLIPAGQPLGRETARSGTRRRGQAEAVRATISGTGSTVAKPAAQPVRVATLAPPEPQPSREVAAAVPAPRLAVIAPPPAVKPAAIPPAPTSPAAMSVPPAPAPAQAAVVPVPQVAVAVVPPAQQPGFTSLEPGPAKAATDSFNLAQLAQPAPPLAIPAASPAAAPQPAPAAAPPEPAVPVEVAAPAAPPKPRSLADAFADLAAPSVEAAPAAGAVDIRRVRPARPAADPKAATAKTPPPPSHPSRIWVQLATGRDKGALAFDWRKFVRDDAEVFKARKGFTSAWGQTNRLLTGPFESQAAANSFIAQLRRAGVAGAFAWSSPAGQMVDALPGR